MADESKKVMDIAKPEDAKVDIGSKPMIVGHGPMLQDPMVTTDTDPTHPGVAQTDATQPAEETVSVTSKKTIRPISDDMVAGQPQESAASGHADVSSGVETAKSESKEETQKVQAPNVAVAATPKTPPEDTTKEEAPAEKEENKPDLDPEALAMEQEDKIGRLVESKKYFVTIRQSRDTSKSTVYIAVITVVVVLLGLFYLVDTKKLDLGFSLPFSVFGSEQTANPTESKGADANAEEELQDSPDETTNTTPTENELTTISRPDEYSIDTPEDWEFSRQTTKSDIGGLSGQETFSDTYTLPSGTKLLVSQVLGGRGGDCQPGVSDVPHDVGNSCPTLEFTFKQRLDAAVSSEYLAEGQQVYAVRQRYTNTKGESTYTTCVITLDEDFNPEVDEPYMGYVTDGCMDIAIGSNTPLVVSVEGVPNTTEEYFANQDIIEIEKVLKTFTYLSVL